MVALRRTKSGDGMIAFGAAVSTTRSERAARWKSGELWDGAGDGNELTANDGWRSSEKALRIGMLRREKDVLCGTLFNDAPSVHDGDAMGDLGDHTEVVSNKQEGQFHFAAELVEQFEDLFLNGDIESGGGLVGDEQFGIGGESHGNHDALAKSAGKLMRQLPGADIGLGNGGSFEGSVNATLQVRTRDMRFVGANSFLNLRANAHDGIQRGHRLLKNHGDLAAADGAPVVFFVEFGQIFWRAFGCGEQSFAGDASAGRKQAHEGERKHGLAATGFADEAERFAGSDAQGEVVDGTDPA